MQFSLRALLLLCSACAIGAAWIGNRAVDYRRQNEARKEVEEAGGSVEAKIAWPSWVAGIVGEESWQEVSEVSFTPAGFYTAAEDCIESPDISDQSMPSIATLPLLKSLSLTGSRLTDAGVTQVTHLKNLRSLDLSGSALGDPALLHLAAMTSLESLDVRGTRVTRAGVERLQTALPKCLIQSVEADDPLGPPP